MIPQYSIQEWQVTTKKPNRMIGLYAEKERKTKIENGCYYTDNHLFAF